MPDDLILLTMKKIESLPKPAPPDPQYAAAADLMRVLCVFLVGWYHIWQQSWLSPVLRVGGFSLDMTAPVRTGYLFVDLMLLLSGFLCYLPYACGRERAAGEFYLRRALRILPSYWFCLAVMLALEIASNGLNDAPRLAADLAMHLGFIHNLSIYSYHMTRLNAVLWTLAVEVQFYLILPALAPVFRRHPLITWFVMTAAAFSFRNLWTLPMEDTTLYVNRLPNMLDVYAAGMLAAHLYAHLAREKERRILVAALGTLALCVGAWGILRLTVSQSHISGFEFVRKGQLARRFPLAVCGALCLAGGSLSFAPLRAAFSNRAVRWLSGITFNFYIWHQWLAVQLKKWRIPPYLAESNPNQAGEQPWQTRYTLLCFAGALLVATALTYLVEKPGARLGRRLAERVRREAEAAAEPEKGEDTP